jgi:predicted SAM-dependent methyltransferase
MNKRSTLLSKLAGNGIEIGALHRPCALPQNCHVKYVDRLTRAQLLEQYPELIGHPLVEPDIIDDAETLRSIPDASQDFVIANHVIEHMRDPIGALLHWARVLKPKGILFLAVPDKHTSFDHARPITEWEHLVLDHQGESKERDFEHFKDFALHVSCRTFNVKPENEAEAFAHELWEKQYSIHYHVWDFPSFSDFLVKLKTNFTAWNLNQIAYSDPDRELQEFIFLLEK